jgi:predicted molibdopterin-dependent oxidoreductase YjgC
MNGGVQVFVNGTPVTVPPGTVVAAAIARAGIAGFQLSPLGMPRGPLCGMGVCMECRVTINGIAHCRSCEMICQDDMEIETAATLSEGARTGA